VPDFLEILLLLKSTNIDFLNFLLATFPFSKTSFFEKMKPNTYLIWIKERCQLPPFSTPKNHQKKVKTWQQLGKK